MLGVLLLLQVAKAFSILAPLFLKCAFIWNARLDHINTSQDLLVLLVYRLGNVFGASEVK